MKKLFWMPLAVLAVFALAFVGCDGGGGDGGEEDVTSPFYHVFASDEAPLKITLDDNFLYGEGYQGSYQKADLFDGSRVFKDDIFWLKVTFKASRDLEDAAWVGLVDTVTNYWNPLTWDGDAEDDEGALLAPEDADEDFIIEEGVEYSVLLKMVALKDAPGKTTTMNVLNIQTKGEGTQGTAGTGVEGPVDLIFTEFVFARDEEFDGDKIPGFEPPDITPPKIELELGEFNTDPFSNANQAGWDFGYNNNPGFDWSKLVAAKYLVIETEGPGDNEWGFGTLSIVLQGDGNSDAWKQTDSGDWNNSGQKGDTTVCYIVIELSSLDDYEDFIGGTKGNIVIGYGPAANTLEDNLGYVTAYLISGDLEEPSGANEISGDISGFITQAKILPE